jgi:hypothetical protein
MLLRISDSRVQEYVDNVCNDVRDESKEADEYDRADRKRNVCVS